MEQRLAEGRQQQRRDASALSGELAAEGTEQSSSQVGKRWLDLLFLVHSEHPDCTMYGVNVLNGNIVSCAKIQRHMRFGLEPGTDASYSFDRTWESLESVCRKIGTGRVDELEFADGRPIRVRVDAKKRRRF